MNKQFEINKLLRVVLRDPVCTGHNGKTLFFAYYKVEFGGVAQWLERRSVAVGLSLIYPWLTCDHFVGKASNQLGKLSLPSLRGR